MEMHLNFQRKCKLKVDMMKTNMWVQNALLQVALMYSIIVTMQF